MRANCVRLRCVVVLAALFCGGVPARLCGQQTAPLAPAADQAAPPVTEFRVVTSDGQVLRVAGDPISIEIGKPLDPAQVASSLKALYRLGNFSDIRAVSQRIASGVRIDFIVQENLFFNQVILQGLKPPPSEASAAAAMGQPHGLPQDFSRASHSRRQSGPARRRHVFGRRTQGHGQFQRL